MQPSLSPPPRESGAANYQLPQQVDDLRQYFDSGRTLPLQWREAQLAALSRLLQENEARIVAALHEDVGKPAAEAFLAETAGPTAHLRHTRKHLRRWARPEKVRGPLALQPVRCHVQPEPLGVVLVIGPWNFPFSLLVNPLIGALAAGNCVLLKPSEVAPATSALVADLVPRYLDPRAVCVVEGGVEETTTLLQQRFDHILYTGNGRVGQIVLEAAAKHLTPTTLELGGKSPLLVDRGVDLERAAARIAAAKFHNCGQVCVAPDYALVHRDVHGGFVAALKDRIEAFWGPDPQQSADYGRIVNARHHARVMALLEGQTLLHGGRADPSDRYLEPTLVDRPAPDSALMQEEIFGPLLPILPVDDMDAAIAFVRTRPKPLAAYLFSNDRDAQQRMQETTSSGALIHNAGFLHMLVPDLPFGGVGASGMGAYHGKASFDTFSHRKAVLRKSLGRDPALLYPPYDDGKLRWLRRLL